MVKINQIFSFFNSIICVQIVQILMFYPKMTFSFTVKAARQQETQQPLLHGDTRNPGTYMSLNPRKTMDHSTYVKTLQKQLHQHLKPSASFHSRKFQPSVTSSPRPPLPSDALFSLDTGCDTVCVCVRVICARVTQVRVGSAGLLLISLQKENERGARLPPSCPSDFQMTETECCKC